MNRAMPWIFKWFESWPIKNAYMTFRRDFDRIIDIGSEDSTEKVKLMRILALSYTSRSHIDKILAKLK